MRALAESIILLWGWQRASVAVLAGAVLALALPPLGFFPSVFIALPVLVWLLDGIGDGGHTRLTTLMRMAFFTGWLFGFGYFLAGLYWIGEAFLVERDKFAWLLPLGIVGLPMVLALFTGLGVMIAHLLWSRSIWRILALAFGLCLAEWLRGFAFTGFPWNNIGTAFAVFDVQMQVAALVGIHGLAALVAVCGSAPAVLADPPDSRHRWAVPALAVVLLVAQWSFGTVRLLFAAPEMVANTRLRIVQPLLTQADRLDPERRQSVVDRLIQISQRPEEPKGENEVGEEPHFTHLIWPESTFPFLITSEPMVLSRIDAMLPTGVVLIAGAARREDGGAGTRRAKIFNSLYVFDDQARILDRYDKVHLVPFGEYLPFQEGLQAAGLFPFSSFGGFTAGSHRRPIVTPQAPPFLPLICYEVIFSAEVVPPNQDRPRWLVNLSDDSWFGDSPGPRQHLLQARLRAVEEGLPLARSTSTGMSAMIDAYGRVLHVLAVGEAGIIDTPLPKALPPPFYALYAEKISLSLLAGLFLSALLGQILALRRRRV